MTNKRKLQLELEKLFKEKSYKLYSNKCLLCGQLGLFHHYIMKSRNGLLKYDVRNAIPLCSFHHYIIHHASPPEIARVVEQIRTKKGKEWCAWVDKTEKIHGTSFNSLKWLKSQKEILENI